MSFCPTNTSLATVSAAADSLSLSPFSSVSVVASLISAKKKDTSISDSDFILSISAVSAEIDSPPLYKVVLFFILST